MAENGGINAGTVLTIVISKHKKQSLKKRSTK